MGPLQLYKRSRRRWSDAAALRRMRTICSSVNSASRFRSLARSRAISRRSAGRIPNGSGASLGNVVPFREFATRKANAAFYRSNRAAAYFGGFFAGDAVPHNERKRLALLSWHQLQFLLKIDHGKVSVLRRRADKPCCDRSIGVGDFASALAVLRVMKIAEDGEEPTAQTGPRAEGIILLNAFASVS